MSCGSLNLNADVLLYRTFIDHDKCIWVSGAVGCKSHETDAICGRGYIGNGHSCLAHTAYLFVKVIARFKGVGSVFVYINGRTWIWVVAYPLTGSLYYCPWNIACLLYTSDAADDLLCVD